MGEGRDLIAGRRTREWEKGNALIAFSTGRRHRHFEEEQPMALESTNSLWKGEKSSDFAPQGSLFVPEKKIDVPFRPGEGRGDLLGGGKEHADELS